jgi:hypothetical protein
MTWWLNVALVGGLEHELLGFFSSQLTFTPSFFRGVGLNHQPGRISADFFTGFIEFSELVG